MYEKQTELLFLHHVQTKQNIYSWMKLKPDENAWESKSSVSKYKSSVNGHLQMTTELITAEWQKLKLSAITEIHGVQHFRYASRQIPLSFGLD